MLKLTLVSLSYNHAAFIKQAVESFITQKTNFDYEIIIADDCSSDESPKIIKEYAEKYPNLIKPILRDKNVGIISNYLDAYSRVKSEYVAYCECDDYFTDPYKLQKQVDFLDAHPECSMCFHKTKCFYENGSKKSVVIPSRKDRFGKSILSISDLLKQNFIPSNSVMYRWIFNNENIYDVFPKDIMPADYYLHFLHAHNGKIGFIDEAMSAYRKHENGTWLDDDSVYQVHGESFLRFYLNVWETFANSLESFFKTYIMAHSFNFMKRMLKTNQIKRIDDFVAKNPAIASNIIINAMNKLESIRFKKRLLIVLSILELVVIFVMFFVYKP